MGGRSDGLRRARIAVVLAACGGLVAAMTLAGAASADHVQPVLVPGNPSCSSQGFPSGLSIDPPASGTYVLPGTGGATVTLTVAGDGTRFAWSSTIGLDGVIAKGGPNANLYRYSPPASGDANLHAPPNASGEPARLSHVQFCFGLPPEPSLQVSKTAHTSYTRTFTWELAKTVDADSHGGLAGSSFSSTYTVAVDRTVAESDFAVSGVITIHNPSQNHAATITGIADSAGETPADVQCAVPQSLAPGGTLQCPYTASLPAKADGTNTVTVTTSGPIGGGSASAGYAFGAPTTLVGDASVVVDDTDPAGPRMVTVSDDWTISYGKVFTCSASAGDYPTGRRVDTYLNTATATGAATNLSASTTVSTDCRLPDAPPTPPGAPNVTVTIAPSTPTTNVGDTIVFTVTVRNQGASTATAVTASGTISPLVSIGSVQPSQGTCTRTGGSFACALGQVAGGASATVLITGTVVSGGNILASASVTGLNETPVSASTVVIALSPQQPLPRPKLGITVNVFPVDGQVRVNGMVLREPRQVPVGALVNARRGRVRVQSFNGSMQFRDGLFRIAERRLRGAATELRPIGGNFLRGCGHPPRRTSAVGSAQTHQKKVVRKLWGNGNGKFRTTGRFSSATVRGTIWQIADRCDGTLVTVRRGRVEVFDNVRKRRVVLRAGQSYLARPAPARR